MFSALVFAPPLSALNQLPQSGIRCAPHAIDNPN